VEQFPDYGRVPAGVAGVLGGHLGGGVADRLIAIGRDGAGDLIGGETVVVLHPAPPRSAIALRRTRPPPTTYGSCLKIREGGGGCG